MSFELRPMTVNDIAAVHAIEAAASSQPWTVGMFHDEVRQSDARSYTVAVFDGHVVGFVGLMLVLNEAHITNIAVDPSQRNARLGTRLLLHTTRGAIARGCQSLTLEVRVSNAAARTMYARFGFAPAGVRKAYYADNNEDALVLWAHDIDTAAYGVRLAGIAALVERDLTAAQSVGPS